MTRALVVAAHGSHYNPGTALPAWRCVDHIRQTGLFDEVTAAFWKEQPSFSTVLDGLRSNQVIVVPLFSSEGYFSQSVLPAELQPRVGQAIRITSVVGSSAFFTAVVADRIQKALVKANFPPAETAVALVGHGTVRHLDSRQTTESQAGLLRGKFAEVHTAYLDDEPYVADLVQTVTCPNLVVVPFFVAEGLHTQDDIPDALGLSDPLYESQVIQNHRVLYTPPVGLEDNLYTVVLALANEYSDSEAAADPGLSSELYWTSHQLAQFGQVSLHADALCHVDDDVNAPDLEILDTPEAIRAKLRFTDSGEFRPLPTRRDLPHGWKIPAPGDASRWAALQMIYPGVWKVERTCSPHEVGARQQGKYRPVRDISRKKVDSLVQSVCLHCVRHPSWHDQNLESVPGCIEPCSVWLEEAIKP